MPSAGYVSFQMPNNPPGNTASNYYYNCRLTRLVSGDTTIGLLLENGDGSAFRYQQGWGTSYYLLASTNSQGFATHYTYQTNAGANLRLSTVSDHVGDLLYTLSYTNRGAYSNLIASVTDRFSRSAQLAYTSDGHLASITDAAGLISSITYTVDGWPDTLVTPYGTTSFAYELGQGGLAGDRWVRVTEPNGGKQVVVFRQDCSTLWSGNTWVQGPVPSTLVPSVPSGSLLDTNLTHGNSFYWNQKQAVNLRPIYGI